MKAIIFLLLMLSTGTRLVSQCMSVELSVQWERNGTISCCNPFLYITYRNNTDDYVYFKVENDQPRFPLIPMQTLLDIERDRNMYKGINYNVFIWSGETTGYGWEVLPDTVDFHKEHETDVTGHMLGMYYNIYYPNKRWLPFFDSAQVTVPGIKENSDGDFLFLAPGESKYYNYDLFPFQLLGGKYTFKSESPFTEKVYVKDLRQRFGYREQELPKKIDQYLLYTGNYVSNEITLIF